MITLRPLAAADDRCGGKAATLGVLMRHGYAVPPGFVVTDPASDRWRSELATGLAELGPGPYAVRSSALAEDGTHASFAGQFHTTLNVPSATAVIGAVAQTAKSGSSAWATAYASGLGLPAVEVIPVLVQQMIAPVAAGVLFTRHPVTGVDQCVLEATKGLADQLVSGSVTPERWTIQGDAIIDHDPAPAAVLSRRVVLELVLLGRRLEALLGAPQDVEWALADNQVWILQARPITALGSTPTPPCAGPSAGLRAPVLVTGTPGSPGRGVGTASVVADLDDFAGFSVGEVLVCHATSPAWTPLLARAAAVVTETGGLLSHAAIVAREFGIPAVMAATNAMSLLSEPNVVSVDGDHGIVTEMTNREDGP